MDDAGAGAHGLRLSRTLLPDLPVEDTTVALMEFTNGAIGTLFSSRALPAPSFPGEDFRFRIIGSDALLDLDAYSETDKGVRIATLPARANLRRVLGVT